MEKRPEHLEGKDPGTSTWWHQEGVMKLPGSIVICARKGEKYITHVTPVLPMRITSALVAQ